MHVDAKLITTRMPRDPEGLVVVLHGGAARRDSMQVSPTQLSVLRMIPVARRIAKAGRGRVGVVRLLNSTRGWDSRHTPVDDVRWALTRLREEYADRPVCLVGHSLGGRAALLSGDQPGVQGVVALNPWVHRSDRVDLQGRRALVVHGSDDRIADPQRALTVARALSATGTVGFLNVTGARHGMLRHGQVFERAAADFVRAVLLDEGVDGPVGGLIEAGGLVTV